MLRFVLTAREGPIWRDYRRLAQHDSVPHALPIGAAGSHSCVSAAKPALPMASKPAKLLLF
jgi:hypothetical protein